MSKKRKASQVDGFGEAADCIGRDGVGSGGIGVVSSGRGQPDDVLRLEEEAAIFGDEGL